MGVAAMKSTPSLRRMWVMFKQLLAEEDLDRRELIPAQTAFHTGARGTLRIMGHLLERGDYDELHGLIRVSD
jgi:hypothetical protein